MPEHKSCIKRLRQDNVRRVNNHFVKATIATLSKKIKKSELDKEQSISLLSEVFSKLDKAAKTGVIHKRTAARRKSRLQEFINKKFAE